MVSWPGCRRRLRPQSHLSHSHFQAQTPATVKGEELPGSLCPAWLLRACPPTEGGASAEVSVTQGAVMKRRPHGQEDGLLAGGRPGRRTGRCLRKPGESTQGPAPATGSAALGLPLPAIPLSARARGWEEPQTRMPRRGEPPRRQGEKSKGTHAPENTQSH